MYNTIIILYKGRANWLITIFYCVTIATVRVLTIIIMYNIVTYTIIIKCADFVLFCCFRLCVQNPRIIKRATKRRRRRPGKSFCRDNGAHWFFNDAGRAQRFRGGMRGRSGCRLYGPPRYRRCIPRPATCRTPSAVLYTHTRFENIYRVTTRGLRRSVSWSQRLGVGVSESAPTPSPP